jgi:hypothetical protein
MGSTGISIRTDNEFQLSVLHSKDQLSKRYNLTDNGLESGKPGTLPDALIPVTLQGLSELKTLLLNLGSCRALCLGVPKTDGEGFKVLTKREATGKPGTITRTKDDLAWPSGHTLALWDHDPDGSPGQTPIESPKQLIDKFAEIDPQWKDLQTLTVPSTSAGIKDANGNLLTSTQRFHVYSVFESCDELKRYVDALFKHCVIRWGHARIDASGKVVIRTIFDLSVFSPERIVYEGGATLGPGLSQERPAPELRPGHRLILDPTKLQVPTKSEYDRHVVSLKAAVADEAAEVREAWLQSRASELAARSGMTIEAAKKTVASRVAGELTADDILIADDGSEVPISAIVDDPWPYNRRYFADPIEPEQGTQKAQLFVHWEELTLHSYLHHGQKYTLPPCPDPYRWLREMREAAGGVTLLPADSFAFASCKGRAANSQVVEQEREQRRLKDEHLQMERDSAEMELGNQDRLPSPEDEPIPASAIPELKRQLDDGAGIDELFWELRRSYQQHRSEFEAVFAGDSEVKKEVSRAAPMRRRTRLSDTPLFSQDLPSPAFLVPGLLPCAPVGIVGEGGVGKSTILLWLAVHLALGRSVLGHDVKQPIRTVIVSREDDEETTLWRIQQVCSELRLNRAEQTLVGENIDIIDVSGQNVRLISAGTAPGDLHRTEHVHDLVKQYRDEPQPMLILLDPTVLLGPGEAAGNDGFAALMDTGRYICNVLGKRKTCVAFVHHTSMVVARSRTVDQYSGRGGAAFADNARGGWRMLLHQDGDEKSVVVPPDVSRDAIGDGRVIRLHFTKQSYGKLNRAPVWLTRSVTGWGFEVAQGEVMTALVKALRKHHQDAKDDAEMLRYLMDAGGRAKKSDITQRDEGPGGMPRTRRRESLDRLVDVGALHEVNEKRCKVVRVSEDEAAVKRVIQAPEGILAAARSESQPGVRSMLAKSAGVSRR